MGRATSRTPRRSAPGTVRDGLVAGAAGKVALDLATYLDMAARGRPASSVPTDTVEASLDRVGTAVPGDRRTRRHRTTALGALGGIGTGLSMGVAVSVGRRMGLRLSRVGGAIATGAVAMTATDAAATRLGVTDPRRWTAAGWAADVVPHLAFGVATHETLQHLEQRDPALPSPRRPDAGLVLRSLALGLAAGARSSLGLAGAARAAGAGRGPRLVAGLGVLGELTADKLPSTPSRLEPPGLVPRFVTATAGAAALAGAANATADLPALAACAGAAAGAFGGAAWRAAAARHRPDWQGAVVEDAVALGLTAWAVRRGPGSTLS